MSLNRAALQAEVNTNLPDNTTGAITPALLRNTLNDILTNVTTLLDADTISGVKTMVPPAFSGLTGVLYGNGSSSISVLTTPQLNALVTPSRLTFTAASVNLNALADTTIAITLPTGFTRYTVSELHISNASVSLTTAAVSLYTAASKGGVNIVAQTTTGITSNTNATNLNTFSATIVNSGTTAYNNATLYFNVGIVQGAPATADVTLIITPLP